MSNYFNFFKKGPAANQAGNRTILAPNTTPITNLVKPNQNNKANDHELAAGSMIGLLNHNGYDNASQLQGAQFLLMTYLVNLQLLTAAPKEVLPLTNHHPIENATAPSPQF